MPVTQCSQESKTPVKSQEVTRVSARPEGISSTRVQSEAITNSPVQPKEFNTSPVQLEDINQISFRSEEINRTPGRSYRRSEANEDKNAVEASQKLDSIFPLILKDYGNLKDEIPKVNFHAFG